MSMNCCDCCEHKDQRYLNGANLLDECAEEAHDTRNVFVFLFPILHLLLASHVFQEVQYVIDPAYIGHER